MAKFTDLPVSTSSSITDAHVFAVATPTTTEQLSLNELQKSITGLTARTTAGINIIGKTTPSGITVGDNGYVGIDNTSPSVALDIGDAGSATIAEARITSRSTARQASFSLKDSATTWRMTKKASDTDFYIQNSFDGTNFTGVLNIDASGNVGIFNGASNLTDKLYVSGGTVKFQSGVSGIVFDPGAAEIRTSVSNDILYLNKSNDDDVVLGDNVLYVENGTYPYVGINNITPQYPLDISGSGIMSRLKNSTTSASAFVITNTTSTGYINLNSSLLSFGRINSASTDNVIYDISNKRLSVGVNGAVSTLHISTPDAKIATFESSDSTANETVQINSYASGPITSNLYTFASGTASLPDKKWSVGLYNNGSYDNNYVFLLDGSTSQSAIRAALDRNGNLDIKGSLTTNTGYANGKFVQMHQTRVTGNCIYFNPFTADSNTNPSGHNSYHAPFGITPFNGSVEKIQILTSDTDCTSLTSPRFEIALVTPTYNAGTPTDYVSGFSISPPSNPVSFPTSGIIGYASLTSLSTNALQTYTKNQFNGSTAFTSGKLLQYRICNSNGTKPVDVDFTVISTISYTIT
jgi:hypothetical protein